MLKLVRCNVTYEYCNSSRAIIKKTIQSNTLKNTVSKSRNKPVVEIGQFSILVLQKMFLEWVASWTGEKAQGKHHSKRTQNLHLERTLQTKQSNYSFYFSAYVCMFEEGTKIHLYYHLQTASQMKSK